MTEFQTPGDLIRHIRKSKRITVVELAERMGVSQDYLTCLGYQGNTAKFLKIHRNSVRNTLKCRHEIGGGWEQK